MSVAIVAGLSYRRLRHAWSGAKTAAPGRRRKRPGLVLRLS